MCHCVLRWYLTSPGLKLILAYRWTWLAILVTGKGRGGMSLFLLFFPCPSHLLYYPFCWGWSDGAKVLCILRHRGVQLILVYSWARPDVLVAGKGRGGMFLFLLFLHFHSCSSFFPTPFFYLFYYLFYLFSPFLSETT